MSGPVPGANTTFTYDDYGRRRTVTDAAGLTLTYDYDALDRVTQVTYPDSDLRGDRLQLARRREAAGSARALDADLLRRAAAAGGDAGRGRRDDAVPVRGSAAAARAAGGGDRLTKLIDPNGNATTWDYDLQGRVTQETRADGSSESYTYETTTSRLKQKTDRKGVTTTFEYFLDGKLKRQELLGHDARGELHLRPRRRPDAHGRERHATP